MWVLAPQMCTLWILLGNIVNPVSKVMLLTWNGTNWVTVGGVVCLQARPDVGFGYITALAADSSDYM